MPGEHPNRIKELAADFTIVYESPEADSVYVYSPGLCIAPGGRLVATADISGPGMERIPGPKRVIEHGREWTGKIWTSDDRGKTWMERHQFPFIHARPFVAGNRVYVLGHSNDLVILCSEDGGSTWGEAALLTQGQRWHQTAANVLYVGDHIYLVMERITRPDLPGWPVQSLAPVLMRGNVNSDLMQREHWTFASELAFLDAVPEDALNFFGVPFHRVEADTVAKLAEGRHCARLGWLEANVVQITSPNHYWYDPLGRTFHLWMRAHTGGTGYAALAKVVEQEDGMLTTTLETVPSGRAVAFVPCPGGQMRFHIEYDAVDRLYWLLSTQAADSMTRAECLPPDRFGLPNNERQRLQLHYSRNCVDWCFAGLVASGNSQVESRHYASMQIDGDDLLILSRSGDARARNAHDVNLITLHRIVNFRGLVYG